MKRRAALLFLITVIAVASLLSACSEDPPSLEDRLVQKCISTVREFADEDLALGTDITDLSFEHMKASLFDGSRATARWLVTGDLTVTKQPTASVAPDTWDDDGATPSPTSDPGPLKCRMGYRESDDQLVVFEYMQYDPTSGGGIGRQIVYEEDSDGGTSDWG